MTSEYVKPVIAVGGENLIDSVHGTDDAGVPNATHNLGGSPYNVALAMARQGQEAHYLTPISTDDFGVRLADHLISAGVVIAAPRSDKPTSQAIVTLSDGIPQYEFLRDGTAERAVTADSIAIAQPADATHFHAGSLAFASGSDAVAWEAAFHAAAKSGMTTSLDPNVRASLIDDPDAYRARIARLLRSAAIVKLSDEDLEWLYPGMSIADAMSALRGATGASLIALTKGPDGAECWTPTLHCTVPNPPLERLVDTIGAGDTFMATLISGLGAQGQLSQAGLSALGMDDLRALLLRGVHAACLNCGQEGCNPPTLTALDAAIAAAT